MHSSLGDDVGVKSVAEVNGINVVAITEEISIVILKVKQKRARRRRTLRSKLTRTKRIERQRTIPNHYT